MDERTFRSNSCTNKKQHTQEAAESIAHYLTRYGTRDKDRHLAPYHCRFCGAWHIGHNSAKAKRIRKQYRKRLIRFYEQRTAPRGQEG